MNIHETTSAPTNDSTHDFLRNVWSTDHVIRDGSTKKILLLHSFCALKNNYCQRQTLWYRQHRLLARPPPTPSPIRNSHERLPAPGPPTSTPHTDDHRRAHLPASDFIRVQQLLNSIVEPSEKTPETQTETQKETDRNMYLWKWEFNKKFAPPTGAVVRGTRQHAPRRLMGGASSAFLAARGARGGSSCCCCSACAECSGLGCRTASAALRVAGGAGCVTTTRRLTISKTLQQTCVLGHYVRSIIQDDLDIKMRVNLEQ